MGAWGPGSFENDDAADFVYELEEADGSKILARALKKALGDEEPDVEAGSRAIAAAEVVAGLKGAPRAELPPEVEDWIAAHQGRHEKDLSPLALRAVDRVRSDSELQDVWAESGDEGWQAALADLERRLSS